MVLVLGVVAVLHVGARELAELQRDFYDVAAVGLRTDAVDVFARPLLPLGRRQPTTSSPRLANSSPWRLH